MASCKHCGSEFIPKTISHRYCSVKCGQAQYFDAHIDESRPSQGGDVSPGTTGAISELLVSADLMKKGYHVFRALSPACPCDLVICNSGSAPLRVEVKSAPRMKDRCYLPGTEGRECDIMAVVYADGIHYEPGLP